MEQERPSDLERAVRDYSGMLYSFALSQTKSVQDAEDVLQEVFLLYIRKAPVFKNGQQQKVWLMRSALNYCRGLWRFRRRHKTIPLEAAEGVVLEGPEEREVFLELDRLPEKYRTVARLYYFGGLSTDEVAQVLGCSPQAVRTRLKRARDMLRARLNDQEKGG